MAGFESVGHPKKRKKFSINVIELSLNVFSVDTVEKFPVKLRKAAEDARRSRSVW